MLFSGVHIIWIGLWCSLVAALWHFCELSWLQIPWIPMSLVGTAVAFYVGFKNNQAYDRLWEARKIWGAIVNSSRAWGSSIKSFITDDFKTESTSDSELYGIRQRLIYRHIAWLYALRAQLLIPTSWEHISQGKHVSRLTQKRMQSFGQGAIDAFAMEAVLKEFLPAGEDKRMAGYKNTATQLIDQQAQELASLRTEGFTDDFRHMELQQLLNDFYVHQGKAERIKKFPLPRQYGSMSFVFVAIFIFLLPIGMASAFSGLGDWGAWFSIPFSMLVCWVYIMMELVGDYSENPFEGLGNDIPMMALCRTIEIDLREMLGETDLPEGIQAKNGVLM